MSAALARSKRAARGLTRLAPWCGALLLALAVGAGADARAQGAMQGVPNAMQGFSQNRDQPIQIEAASLEMVDKKKEATFSGNVKVVQGDTTMQSKSLVVFYDSSNGADKGKPAPKKTAMKSAAPGAGTISPAIPMVGGCLLHAGLMSWLSAPRPAKSLATF